MYKEKTVLMKYEKPFISIFIPLINQIDVMSDYVATKGKY